MKARWNVMVKPRGGQGTRLDVASIEHGATACVAGSVVDQDEHPAIDLVGAFKAGNEHRLRGVLAGRKRRLYNGAALDVDARDHVGGTAAPASHRVRGQPDIPIGAGLDGGCDTRKVAGPVPELLGGNPACGGVDDEAMEHAIGRPIAA